MSVSTHTKPTKNNKQTRTFYVQSVERAMDLLDALSSQSGGLSLKEISKRVGLNGSTTYRILATLSEHGYVRQGKDKSYRLGFQLLQLGEAARSQINLRDEAIEFLEVMAIECGELANLVVPSDFQVTYIAQASGRFHDAVRLFTRLGARVPLHCTGVGKSILANMSADEIDQYIKEQGLPGFTEFTITNPIQLRQELENIRNQGYAIDYEEFNMGVRCVASPIRDKIGCVVAAVGVSGPAVRITPDRFPELGSLVSRTALEISRSFGFRGENLMEKSCVQDG